MTDYKASENGLFILTFEDRPKLAGRIKIAIMNALLFPVVKITYKGKK